MLDNTLLLIQKIKVLITALEKTDNQTSKLFKKIIDIIQIASSDEELKRALDSQIIHSGRIKDYGGYNREQCNLFNEMWEVADSIYNDIQ